LGAHFGEVVFGSGPFFGGFGFACFGGEDFFESCAEGGDFVVFFGDKGDEFFGRHGFDGIFGAGTDDFEEPFGEGIGEGEFWFGVGQLGDFPVRRLAEGVYFIDELFTFARETKLVIVFIGCFEFCEGGVCLGDELGEGMAVGLERGILGFQEEIDPLAHDGELSAQDGFFQIRQTDIFEIERITRGCPVVVMEGEEGVGDGVGEEVELVIDRDDFGCCGEDGDPEEDFFLVNFEPSVEHDIPIGCQVGDEGVDAYACLGVDDVLEAFIEGCILGNDSGSGHGAECM